MTPEEQQEKLRREKLHEKTFKRAINLLTYRARSVGEMRERLMEKPWSDSTIVEDVIEKLLGYGYLNDLQFAADLAISRLRQKPMGRRVLQQKLMVKKLDSEIVRAALDQGFAELPEEQLIDRAIDKRLRVRGRPGSREELKKFFDHLVRQGFSYTLISEKMRALSKAGGEVEVIDEVEEF